uniref:Uncharacterized protein n=1 Tax=Setaria italica TaxID=4555 RepID=K3YBH6_SETIT
MMMVAFDFIFLLLLVCQHLVIMLIHDQLFSRFYLLKAKRICSREPASNLFCYSYHINSYDVTFRL